MNARPSRHAQEYWLKKQALLAVKIADLVCHRCLQELPNFDDVWDRDAIEGELLETRIEIAHLLEKAEQLDRRAQELKP